MKSHLSLLCFAGDIVVRDWGFKYFLEQMRFVSSCSPKVDRLCGKKVYLPKRGCEELQAGLPLSHRRWASGEADVLVELMNHDFWFHCQSAGVHSGVCRVNFYLVVQ